MYTTACSARAICSRYTYERKAIHECRSRKDNPLLAKDLEGPSPNFPNLPNWNVFETQDREYKKWNRLFSITLPGNNINTVKESDVDSRNSGSRQKIEYAVYSSCTFDVLQTINEFGWNPEYIPAPIIDGKQINSGLSLYMK